MTAFKKLKDPNRINHIYDLLYRSDYMVNDRELHEFLEDIGYIQDGRLKSDDELLEILHNNYSHVKHHDNHIDHKLEIIRYIFKFWERYGNWELRKILDVLHHTKCTEDYCIYVNSKGDQYLLDLIDTNPH